MKPHGKMIYHMENGFIMIKTEKKHQNRNLKTANLLNRFPAIILIITLLFSFSCKNDEKGTNSDSEGDDSVMVDTLGQTLKRVIIKRHENGKPNIAHYIKDEGDYFYMQSWESGKKYISGWYKNNKREGEWISWYENGQLWSKGSFDDGKRDGKSKVYFDNGNLR